MTIGERIAYVREQREVLQKDLAKAIDIDPVVLNRIEKNKRPVRAEELKAIANYFDVSTDYLLENEGEHFGNNINDDEMNVVLSYRSLDDEGKTAVKWIIKQKKTTFPNVSSTRLPTTGILKKKANFIGRG